MTDEKLPAPPPTQPPAAAPAPVAEPSKNEGIESKRGWIPVGLGIIAGAFGMATGFGAAGALIGIFAGLFLQNSNMFDGVLSAIFAGSASSKGTNPGASNAPGKTSPETTAPVVGGAGPAAGVGAAGPVAGVAGGSLATGDGTDAPAFTAVGGTGVQDPSKQAGSVGTNDPSKKSSWLDLAGKGGTAYVLIKVGIGFTNWMRNPTYDNAAKIAYEPITSPIKRAVDITKWTASKAANGVIELGYNKTTRPLLINPVRRLFGKPALESVYLNPQLQPSVFKSRRLFSIPERLFGIEMPNWTKRISGIEMPNWTKHITGRFVALNSVEALASNTPGITGDAMKAAMSDKTLRTTATVADGEAAIKKFDAWAEQNRPKAPENPKKMTSTEVKAQKEFDKEAARKMKQLLQEEVTGRKAAEVEAPVPAKPGMPVMPEAPVPAKPGTPAATETAVPKYSAKSTLNSGSRGSNWLMMLLGGKGAWDQYKAGKLNTMQGAESTFMLGAGLAGESSALFSQGSRVGGVLRVAPAVAAPFVVKDGVKDLGHVLGIYTSEEDEKATKARYAKKADAVWLGIGDYGLRGEASHDALRGASKIVLGAEGSYIAGRAALRGAAWTVGKSVVMKKIEQKVAQKLLQVGATRALGAAAGYAVPGLNIILATDLVCDLAVDAAERHTEEGMNRMNYGVALVNNLRQKLPQYSPSIFEHWQMTDDYRSMTPTAYLEAIKSSEIAPERMDAHLEIRVAKKNLEERIATEEKLLGVEKDDEKKKVATAALEEMKASLKKISSLEAEDKKQLESEVREALKAKFGNKADPKNYVADATQRDKRVAEYMEWRLSEETLAGHTTMKMQLNRRNQLIRDDRIQFGSKERSIEILEQYPNIYVPLERSGLLKTLDDKALNFTTTYKSSDGQNRTMSSTFELRQAISKKQEEIIASVNAMADEVTEGSKVWGIGKPQVSIGGIGYEVHTLSMGYTRLNTAYNDFWTHIFEGHNDNSLVGELARLKEYQQELVKDGHKSENLPNEKMFWKIEKMFQEMDLIVKLEQAKDALDERGFAEHEAIVAKPDGTPELDKNGRPRVVKQRIPHLLALVDKDLASAEARDYEVRTTQKAIAARNAEVINLSKAVVEEGGVLKPIKDVTHEGAKLATDTFINYDGNVPIDKVLLAIHGSGLIDKGMIDESRQQVEKEALRIKEELLKDPDIVKQHEELRVLNKDFEPLGNVLPSLLVRTEVLFAEKKKAELKLELEALSQHKEFELQRTIEIEKSRITANIAKLDKQIAERKVVDPVALARASELVFSPRALEALQQEREAIQKQIEETQARVKTLQQKDKEGKLGSELDNAKVELAALGTIKKALPDDVLVADITTVQKLLVKRVAFDKKLNSTKAKIHEQVQTRILEAQAQIKNRLLIATDEKLAAYAAENNRLFDSIASRPAPKLEGEKQVEAKKLLEAYLDSKRDFAVAVQKSQNLETSLKATSDHTTEVEKHALESTHTQLTMLKAQRQYYEYLTVASKEQSVSSSSPENDTVKAVIAFENSNFDQWASSALAVAKTENSKKAIGDLVVLRQQALEARTESSLMGLHADNPLAGRVFNTYIAEYALRRTSQLSTAELQALASVNKEYEQSLKDVKSPDSYAEASYRKLDKVLRGDVEQISLERIALGKIWQVTGVDPSTRQNIFSPVKIDELPVEKWSPANEIMMREMYRQLRVYERNDEAERLAEQAACVCQIDLKSPEVSGKTLEPGTMEIPTQSPKMTGNYARYAKEENYRLSGALYDPAASKATYALVSEDEALRNFFSNVRKSGFDRAMDGLKLFNDGKFFDGQGQLNDDGKKFLAKLDVLLGEPTMRLAQPKELSVEAKALLERWDTDKKITLPEYSVANELLLNEIVNQQFTASGNGVERARNILSLAKESNDWKNRISISVDQARFNGNLGLLIATVSEEIKANSELTRADDQSELEFNINRMVTQQELQEKFQFGVNSVREFRGLLKAQGVILPDFSAETETRINQTTTQLVKPHFDNAILVAAGKTLENSRVETLRRETEPENANEPDIDAEEKKQRETRNEEKKKTYEGTLKYAQKEDAESARVKMSEYAGYITKVLKDNPSVTYNATSELKDALTSMAVSILHVSSGYDGNRHYIISLEDRLKSLDEYSAAIKKATGFDVPKDVVKAEYMQHANAMLAFRVGSDAQYHTRTLEAKASEAVKTAEFTAEMQEDKERLQSAPSRLVVDISEHLKSIEALQHPSALEITRKALTERATAGIEKTEDKAPRDFPAMFEALGKLTTALEKSGLKPINKLTPEENKSVDTMLQSLDGLLKEKPIELAHYKGIIRNALAGAGDDTIKVNGPDVFFDTLLARNSALQGTTDQMIQDGEFPAVSPLPMTSQSKQQDGQKPQVKKKEGPGSFLH